ncbi:MAG: Holliday junction resolvase RuvX [Candidatus Aminicenantia bacterium]
MLGIDFGDKKIGLAISDELGVTVHPLGQYIRKSSQEDKDYFKELIKKYNISQVVIGLPIRMDGTKGKRVQKTEEFGKWLQGIINVPISFWDERLSTKQAIELLKTRKMKWRERKKHKDQISAAIILFSYLESRR